MPYTKLMDALDRVEDNATGDTISLGDVVDNFNGRGFGALLILPSLLVVLPTGGLPFVPVVCGLFMILICSQIVIGKRHPWLPKTLRKTGFTREKYEQAVNAMRPYIGFVDRLSTPRLKVLSRPLSQRVVAIICILLSFVTAAVALLPIASHIFAFAILCFAIGISSRDGIMTILGFIVTIAAFALMPMIIASTQDLMGPHLIAPLPEGF